MLMIGLFGAGFRRPLVLLRAFVLELSLASLGPIRFARCCTAAMTEDERQILGILQNAATDTDQAKLALSRLMRNTYVWEPLSAAIVFNRAAAERRSSPAVPGEPRA